MATLRLSIKFIFAVFLAALSLGSSGGTAWAKRNVIGTIVQPKEAYVVYKKSPQLFTQQIVLTGIDDPGGSMVQMTLDSRQGLMGNPRMAIDQNSVAHILGTRTASYNTPWSYIYYNVPLFTNPLQIAAVQPLPVPQVSGRFPVGYDIAVDEFNNPMIALAVQDGTTWPAPNTLYLLCKAGSQWQVHTLIQPTWQSMDSVNMDYDWATRRVHIGFNLLVNAAWNRPNLHEIIFDLNTGTVVGTQDISGGVRGRSSNIYDFFSPVSFVLDTAFYNTAWPWNMDTYMARNNGGIWSSALRVPLGWESDLAQFPGKIGGGFPHSIFAAVGELNVFTPLEPFGSDAVNLYQSHDGGATWSSSPITSGPFQNFGAVNIAQYTFPNFNPQKLFVMFNMDQRNLILAVTSDLGATWRLHTIDAVGPGGLIFNGAVGYGR